MRINGQDAQCEAGQRDPVAPCPRAQIAPPPPRARLAAVALTGLLISAAATAAHAQSAGPQRAPDVAAGALDAAAPAAAVSGASGALDNPLGIPDLRSVLPAAKDAAGVTGSMAIFVLLTVLSLAPAILVMTTCFTRIVIVLALLRQAIGTQQLPPGQVLMGLSLILTALIMAPTWMKIQSDALDPYMEGRLSQTAALQRAVAPLRDFMIRQIEIARNEEDVYVFVEHGRGVAWPADRELRWSEVGTWELIPAFVMSEMKTAFLMGFRMYLPFLIVDMVISAILISMGMLMLPPVLISLPFKLLLFVIADGWTLVIGSLLASFG